MVTGRAVIKDLIGAEGSASKGLTHMASNLVIAKGFSFIFSIDCLNIPLMWQLAQSKTSQEDQAKAPVS